MQENVQQQGWRTYLYDAEQPYTPVASVTGRGESRQVWYYHTDVTGTPQEVTAADGNAGMGGVYQGVWRECGGHQQQRGVLSPAAAAAGAVF